MLVTFKSESARQAIIERYDLNQDFSIATYATVAGFVIPETPS